MTDARFAIGICTRRRPEKLERLLESIRVSCALAGAKPDIIVVENDTQTSLRDVAFPSGLNTAVTLHPEIGLSTARNRVLAEVENIGSDWFVGLDDDEWVDESWFTELLSAISKYPKTDMFFGPCNYVYGEDLSPYLSPDQFMTLRPGDTPEVMTTQNFAIHRDVFSAEQGVGLRFHEAFNETGGEDLDFFLRATRQHGMVAMWIPSMIVNEDRKNERATLAYRLDRSRRNLLSALRVDLLHCREFGYGSFWLIAFRTIAMVYADCVWGTLGLLVGCSIFLVRREYGQKMIGKALRRYARIVGATQFMFGIRPKAYGQSVVPD